MKSYYRVMLGMKSAYAEECFKGNFIGADFELPDLTGKLPDNYKEFNKEFIPVFLKNRPDKKKGSAGLACGALWTVSKGILKGDIVICPDGKGFYFVGEVIGNYFYVPGGVLPHRRSVNWYPKKIERSQMSKALQNSTGSIGTVSEITKYSNELEKLLTGALGPTIKSSDETVEDASVFALEEHLEDFLVKNWKQTEFGKFYDIFEEDGEIGQQYPCETGRIDILAISKDKKTFLVIELKKGRASDYVVGQVQRYMGCVLEELATECQEVKGVIIAAEDDIGIRRALSVTRNIEFHRYQVNFKLSKVI